MFNRIKDSFRRPSSKDPVKQAARKLRELGQALGATVESIGVNAAEQVVDLEATLRKTERSLRDAKRRTARPAADIANIAAEFVGDIGKQLRAAVR